MDQIELTKPPMAGTPLGEAEKSKELAQQKPKSGKLDVTAYVENGRLKLTADVGPGSLSRFAKCWKVTRPSSNFSPDA